MRLRYLFGDRRGLAILSSTAMAAPIANSSGALGPWTGSASIPVHDTCHSSCANAWRFVPASALSMQATTATWSTVDDDDDDDYDDCHHNVLRHSLPGYGRVWHRHRGSSCRVEIYEREERSDARSRRLHPGRTGDRLPVTQRLPRRRVHCATAGRRQNSIPFCAFTPERKGCFTCSISVTRSAASISSSLAFRPVTTTCFIGGRAPSAATTSAVSR